ncbi:P110/LppT family adhesin N-terminal domain [Mycoplasma sp. 1654_15]|uniref:P110/LppT family adhesin N-terminal domain n=1 Tax=Mycoplasma sp. 1654_15 TaxID=2725994 RepID=UPI00144A179A|nr:P110/LppT family adhesin N-terminal domain [Mycoplasma sp. 1654_15]QJB71353.1 hypothetical protein HF996_02620 [Mycoplasma sp. 1654_15]
MIKNKKVLLVLGAVVYLGVLVVTSTAVGLTAKARKLAQRTTADSKIIQLQDSNTAVTKADVENIIASFKLKPEFTKLSASDALELHNNKTYSFELIDAIDDASKSKLKEKGLDFEVRTVVETEKTDQFPVSTAAGTTIKDLKFIVFSNTTDARNKGQFFEIKAGLSGFSTNPNKSEFSFSSNSKLIALESKQNLLPSEFVSQLTNSLNSSSDNKPNLEKLKEFTKLSLVDAQNVPVFVDNYNLEVEQAQSSIQQDDDKGTLSLLLKLTPKNTTNAQAISRRVSVENLNSRDKQAKAIQQILNTNPAQLVTLSELTDFITKAKENEFKDKRNLISNIFKSLTDEQLKKEVTLEASKLGTNLAEEFKNNSLKLIFTFDKEQSLVQKTGKASVDVKLEISDKTSDPQQTDTQTSSTAKTLELGKFNLKLFQSQYDRVLDQALHPTTGEGDSIVLAKDDQVSEFSLEKNNLTTFGSDIIANLNKLIPARIVEDQKEADAKKTQADPQASQDTTTTSTTTSTTTTTESVAYKLMTLNEVFASKDQKLTSAIERHLLEYLETILSKEDATAISRVFALGQTIPTDEVPATTVAKFDFKLDQNTQQVLIITTLVDSTKPEEVLATKTIAIKGFVNDSPAYEVAKKYGAQLFIDATSAVETEKPITISDKLSKKFINPKDSEISKVKSVSSLVNDNITYTPDAVDLTYSINQNWQRTGGYIKTDINSLKYSSVKSTKDSYFVKTPSVKGILLQDSQLNLKTSSWNFEKDSQVKKDIDVNLDPKGDNSATKENIAPYIAKNTKVAESSVYDGSILLAFTPYELEKQGNKRIYLLNTLDNASYGRVSVFLQKVKSTETLSGKDNLQTYVLGLEYFAAANLAQKNRDQVRKIWNGLQFSYPWNSGTRAVILGTINFKGSTNNLDKISPAIITDETSNSDEDKLVPLTDSSFSLPKYGPWDKQKQDIGEEQQLSKSVFEKNKFYSEASKENSGFDNLYLDNSLSKVILQINLKSGIRPNNLNTIEDPSINFKYLVYRNDKDIQEYDFTLKGGNLNFQNKDDKAVFNIFTRGIDFSVIGSRAIEKVEDWSDWNAWAHKQLSHLKQNEKQNLSKWGFSKGGTSIILQGMAVFKNIDEKGKQEALDSFKQTFLK